MSYSSRPYELYSPWNSPGQNTGVVAVPFSTGSSQPRDWSQVSCIAGGFFTSWATREAWHTLSEGFYGYVKCSSPLWWKGHLFWVLVLEVLVGLHRTIQLQLLQHYWLGHRLRLLWYRMACLERNRDHSVVCEIASKYCISDSFVHYNGYSISSKGFLPTVVDIMVIWVKFTHSSPFQFADS